MPPQLLTLTTPLLRTRTLIHLTQHTDEKTTNGWEAVVSSLADYDTWYDRNARIVGIVVDAATVDDLPHLYECAKNVTLVLISEAVLSLKTPAYWEENFDNLLVLEQLHESYPFMAPWLGSTSDAVAIFGQLLRYQRLVAATPSPRIRTIASSISTPPSIWLITQYFKATGSPDRQEEIRACLRANLICSDIERVVLLNEQDYSREWRAMEEKEKIVQIVTKKRLTYAHVLQFIHDEVPPNVIVVLANADIFFGPRGLRDLWELDLVDKALALLRWDVEGTTEADQEAAVMFGPRADSQDAWVILSDSVRSRNGPSALPYAVFDFPLGKAGCDNAFAAHLLRQRFSLFNPSLSVKSYHLHTSGVRTYSKADAIRSDLYVNLVPTRLIGTKQSATPTGQVSYVCHESVAFEVKSSSLSNEMTYCAMLEKDGRYKWEATVENYFFEPAVSVYHVKNAGVTHNGLMFTPDEIIVGKDAEKFAWWEDSALDILTPLQPVKKMLALPFETVEVFTNREQYFAEYLSWVARLRKDHSDLGFWVPAAWWKEVAALPLEDAVMIPWTEGCACWAEEVVGLLPGPHEVGHEEIQALREWYPTWLRDAVVKKCAVRIEGVHADSFMARVQKWLGPTWMVGTELEGASMAIVSGMQPLWRLPVDAIVIEFQQELSLRGEMQHLAHVSDLRSWVLLLARGTAQDVENQMIEQLEKWGKRNDL